MAQGLASRGDVPSLHQESSTLLRLCGRRTDTFWRAAQLLAQHEERLVPSQRAWGLDAGGAEKRGKLLGVLPQCPWVQQDLAFQHSPTARPMMLYQMPQLAAVSGSFVASPPVSCLGVPAHSLPVTHRLVECPALQPEHPDAARRIPWGSRAGVGRSQGGRAGKNLITVGDKLQWQIEAPWSRPAASHHPCPG